MRIHLGYISIIISAIAELKYSMFHLSDRNDSGSIAELIFWQPDYESLRDTRNIYTYSLYLSYIIKVFFALPEHLGDHSNARIEPLFRALANFCVLKLHH